MPQPRTLRVEYVPLGDVKIARRNPKGHDLATIRASILRHGLGDVAGIVDERTGRLVAGHGRAVLVSAEIRSWGVASGRSASSNAAAAETWGVAALVPRKFVVYVAAAGASVPEFVVVTMPSGWQSVHDWRLQPGLPRPPPPPPPGAVRLTRAP